MNPRHQIVHLPVIRIIRDPDGGWYVIAPNGHAWLHGDRAGALTDKGWLDRQWGRR